MPVDFATAQRRFAEKPRPPRDGTNAHRVTVVVGGKQITGWTDYEVVCSMVEPADGFSLRRAFDLEVWKLCELDAEVKIAIDNTIVLDGFIDDRARAAAAGTISIAGRDKAGRLVQESIPKVSGFDGLQMTEVLKQLASPWFTTVTLSDARNRSVRRGKGHRAPAGEEPAVFKVAGKLDEEHGGRMDPGETRWAMIEQIVSSVGLLCWSSADGRELVVGKPNYTQQVQYLFRHSKRDGSTIKDLNYQESVQEGFALIEVHGTGTGDDGEYDTASYIGSAKDGPNADGTGRDFRHPKRLVVAQSAFESNAEAQRAAEREMKRRNFKRRHATIEAPLHGQLIAGSIMTLFAPNTLARVIDDELELDEAFLLYACRFSGSATGGASTNIMCVPRGTEFVA